jgi:O-antigen/teichoic acid export membrane protein
MGVRLLTQFLPPAEYGTVTLMLGIVAFAMTALCTPLTQAVMHFYPSMASAGSLGALRASLERCLGFAYRWGMLAFAIGAAAVSLFVKEGWLLSALLAALLLSDSWRSVHWSILNSQRRQSEYAMWASIDAWGRPLLATAAIFFLQKSAATVVGAYLAVSIALLTMFSRTTWKAAATPGKDSHADAQLWKYALPLIPLGLISWVNNLGDRYLIGATLGLGSAGVYAAIYGLSSMPFMAVSGTIEQALRPVYQCAVTAGNLEHARKILGIWLAMVIAICGLGVLIYALLHDGIARLLLGARYRYAADIMPWIAAGYAIRSVSYVFERVCYANGRTRDVLVIQVCAAVVTAIATPVGALGWGLMGAAVAVPVYFSAQLAAAIYFARRSQADRAPALSLASGST